MPANLSVLLVSLVLGLAAGAIMHRADFCMTAAFRDLFLFRSKTLLIALLMLITVSAVLIEVVHVAGWLVAYPFPLLGAPTLGSLFGGILFGIGMVLAGGCVVGILYKVGAGCLLCWWGVAGLLLGSALFAEIYPAWSTLAPALRLTTAITLPQLLGISPLWCVTALLLSIPLFRRHSACFKSGAEWQGLAGYLPPCQAAMALAGIGFLAVLLLGMPLGVTTSYAKVVGYCESLIFPEHFAGLDFFRTQPLRNLALPLADTPLQGGPGKFFDGIALIQYPLILGIVAGSALSALSLGEWRLQAGAPLRQKLWVLAGGILMGVAARLSAGCNIWHLWGGLPIFTLSSMLFAIGLFPGAWLGGKILTRWVLPERPDQRTP